jgi:hypothetical protein
MASSEKRTAKTYGDLRKLLAEMGDPWHPDPTKSDDEPLPEFPTGGDGVFEPDSRTMGKGGVDELLKDAPPPANPDVQAEWREAGLLPDEAAEPTRPARQQRKTPPTTPAPDSGG